MALRHGQCSHCGELMQLGPGSARPERRVCRSCRRQEPQPYKGRTELSLSYQTARKRPNLGKSPRPCEWCDATFQPKTGQQTHCSMRCAGLHRQYRVRQATGYQSPHTRKWPAKGSSKERGFTGEHVRLRKQLLPLAYNTPCPMCGEIMHEQQQLDLDHIRPRVHGGTATRDNVRIVHHHCNRRAGQKLGHQRRQH